MYCSVGRGVYLGRGGGVDWGAHQEKREVSYEPVYCILWESCGRGGGGERWEYAGEPHKEKG